MGSNEKFITDKKMGNKPEKNKLRTLIFYAIFGSAITFGATILIYWILEDIVPPIPMALVIGALVGIAFKLFTNAITREQNPKT